MSQFSIYCSPSLLQRKLYEMPTSQFAFYIDLKQKSTFNGLWQIGGLIHTHSLEKSLAH